MVSILPEARRGEGEEGQRSPFAGHGGQHLVAQGFVLEDEALGEGRLHEGAPQGLALQRAKGHQVLEDRGQGRVAVAAHQEVVAKGQEDVDVSRGRPGSRGSRMKASRWGEEVRVNSSSPWSTTTTASSWDFLHSTTPW